MSEQLSIDGSGIQDVTNITESVRKIMQKNMIVWRSHRLLMLEMAKLVGFRYDRLDSDQRYAFERLLDMSPDVERAAHKVREERPGMTITNVVFIPGDPHEDPFEAVQRIQKKIRSRR